MDGGMQGLLSVPLSLLHKSATLSLDELALVETLGIGAHAVNGVAFAEVKARWSSGPALLGLQWPSSPRRQEWTSVWRK